MNFAKILQLSAQPGQDGLRLGKNHTDSKKLIQNIFFVNTRIPGVYKEIAKYFAHFAQNWVGNCLTQRAAGDQIRQISQSPLHNDCNLCNLRNLRIKTNKKHIEYDFNRFYDAAGNFAVAKTWWLRKNSARRLFMNVLRFKFLS